MRKIGKLMDNAIQRGNLVYARPIENEIYGTPNSLCQEPKTWGRGKSCVSHILYETVYDLDEYPYAEYCDVKNCHLVDKRGNIIGSASVFVVGGRWKNIDNYRKDISNIYECIDGVREDLSILYFHPWVQDIPKETEVVVFVDRIEIEDAFKGKGFGKWLLGAALSDALEMQNDNVVIALMISPTETNDAKDEGIVYYGTRDKEAYEREGTKLLQFYEKAFNEIGESHLFRECDISYRVDTEVKGVTAIAVFTATERINKTGGKK